MIQGYISVMCFDINVMQSIFKKNLSKLINILTPNQVVYIVLWAL